LGHKKCHDKFDQILLVSIDEAFYSLGETLNKKIYFYLDNNFQLARQDIPLRIRDFSDILERIFGLGARHLETLIMKTLHSKMADLCNLTNLNNFGSDLTFESYVALVKQVYEDTVVSEIMVIPRIGEMQYCPEYKR
jgi:hypothetical protein